MNCLSATEVFAHLTGLSYVCAQEYQMHMAIAPPSATRYVIGFALTLLAEAPFYLWLSRKQKWPRRLAGLLVCNLLTHPALHYVLLSFARVQHWTLLEFLIVGEMAALIIEIVAAKKIYRTNLGPTVLWMTAANLFSWGLS